MGNVPVLILPGLYNSGPDHWQTLWEARYPEFHRVVQDDWDRPRCADWVARLDSAVRKTPGAVLVAHSSACAMVAHWASTRSGGRVRGALLVGPSDPEAPSYPAGPTGFGPMPLSPLPFPSVVVASTDDPFVTSERAREFASAWGSRLVTVAGAGHLNSQSGLGDWPAGLRLLDELRGMAEGEPAGVDVVEVGVDQAATVFALVAQLLRELGEEGDETGPLDEAALAAGWRARPQQHFAFLARAGDRAPIGVATVVEAFAVYAGGAYGIINEMYVAPGFRSAGVGARLVDAVAALGRARGWRRVDVTAPESTRWSRTRRFYENLGFRFTGPKLKLALSQDA